MWDAIAVSLLILDAIIDIIDWSFVAYIFFDLRKRENIYWSVMCRKFIKFASKKVPIANYWNYTIGNTMLIPALVLYLRLF